MQERCTQHLFICLHKWKYWITLWYSKKRSSLDSVVKAWNPEQSCQSVSEQRPDCLWFQISSLWLAQRMLLLKILPLAVAVSAGLGVLSLISFDQCCKHQTAHTHMVWWPDWKVLIPQGSESIFLLKEIFTAVRLKCFVLSKATERWCLPEFNVQAPSLKKLQLIIDSRIKCKSSHFWNIFSLILLETSAQWWYYFL